MPVIDPSSPGRARYILDAEDLLQRIPWERNKTWSDIYEG